jgi:hypothetical protein
MMKLPDLKLVLILLIGAGGKEKLSFDAGTYLIFKLKSSGFCTR